MNNRLIKYFISLVGILIFFNGYSNMVAQSDNFINIKYNNKSIREIASQYLGNPDLWELILDFNNISELTDLEDGSELKIPTKLVLNTFDNIDKTKELISKANLNGAKIFIPDVIEKAEMYFNKSIKLKKNGEWELALDTSNNALEAARESLRQALFYRRTSADATLSYVLGNVKKKRPADIRWAEADIFTKLYEADKTRTADNSFAEITFIDLSRIRLNENSQATIENNRVDLLLNKTETKVKLVRGDAFAYLLNTPKKKFDIDIPGLNAKINSKNFWIEREIASTKIANFDGEIELSAQDSTVQVKKNQGTIIKDGQAPEKPRELLNAPTLKYPIDGNKFVKNEIQFSWDHVDSTIAYWLEIAKDSKFKKIIYSNKNISKTNKSVSLNEKGAFYWHVCSLDENKLPGNFSATKYFMITKKNSGPYLTCEIPKEYIGVKTEKINVSGRADIKSRVFINGIETKIYNDGLFKLNYTLVPGINNIRIKCINEFSDSTSITRNVIYENSNKVINNILNENYNKVDNLFLTNSSDFSIQGLSRPLSNINYHIGDQTLTVWADVTGKYRIKLELNKDINNLNLIVNTLAGYSAKFNYKIKYDENPPEIVLLEPIPKFTMNDVIYFRGKLSEPSKISINKSLYNTFGQEFEYEYKLSNGVNKVEIEAIDRAGNLTSKFYNIIFDKYAPELISHSIKKGNDGFVYISALAKDDSGLRKTSMVKVIIGKEIKKYVLILDREKNVYSKRIWIGENMKISIVNIQLEDYLGNFKEYQISE